MSNQPNVLALMATTAKTNAPAAPTSAARPGPADSSIGGLGATVFGR
jgi:hypothetical protein